MMQTKDGHLREIEGIYRRLTAWRRANPDKRPTLQFNYPKHIGVISTIKNALGTKFFAADADGMEMLKAICDMEEHTLLMLRVALDMPPPKQK